MKVIALTNRCIASGACVLACSQVFNQRESDGVVELLQERPSLELLKKVQLAVAACPSQVFVVEDDDDQSELTLTTNDQEI
jgi:ferredoxin